VINDFYTFVLKLIVVTDFIKVAGANSYVSIPVRLLAQEDCIEFCCCKEIQDISPTFMGRI
jgi:hypothetical protein